MLQSYGNQVETSLSYCSHTCTDLGISVGGEVEENLELKNLLKWHKFSFYAMVNFKVFTCLKNKKYLILIVNKKFRNFEF